MFFLPNFNSLSSYPYYNSSIYPPQQKSAYPLIFFCLENAHFFLPLDYPTQKRKKATRPHYQNDYSLILPVTVPYLLLNWGLSFLQPDKAYRTCVRLCFPQTYPCCINHHSGLIFSEISSAG